MTSQSAALRTPAPDARSRLDASCCLVCFSVFIWVIAIAVVVALGQGLAHQGQWLAGSVQVLAALVWSLPAWRERQAVSIFIATWRHVRLSEKSAAQQQFVALCRLVGFPAPAEADPAGEFYTFERRAVKTSGGDGFADVWYRDRFAIEFKGPRANLDQAFQQLLDYSRSLGNPPLLIVSDMYRFEIHTNFPDAENVIYVFTIDDMIRPETLALVSDAFTRPERLRPPSSRRWWHRAAAS